MRPRASATTVALCTVTLVALVQVPGERGADESSERLCRDNAPKFHRNFSAGQLEKNGPLVAEDIDVDSNNVKLVEREDFVKRIERHRRDFEERSRP
jgi:hypothetical protein